MTIMTKIKIGNTTIGGVNVLPLTKAEKEDLEYDKRIHEKLRDADAIADALEKLIDLYPTETLITFDEDKIAHLEACKVLKKYRGV